MFKRRTKSSQQNTRNQVYQSQAHGNESESQGFVVGALRLRGSVTPRILPNLLLMSLYCLGLETIDQ